MRPSNFVSFEPNRLDVQFCVRECAIFKFRPAGAPPLARPPEPQLFAAGAAPSELVPLPSAEIERAFAFRVSGGAMRGVADAGALIYFEAPRSPPTSDMLGHVVVVQIGAEVLARRLLRGSRPGLFDLESRQAPIIRDAPLRWAAHIAAIIPPPQARRILIAGGCGTSPASSRCPSRSGQPRE